ncbi:MAG: ATP-binding protein [Lachnospiraceae bacterium]
MANYDSMTELFLEECGNLLQDYAAVEEAARQYGSYTPEALNELFRITHTLKGDATMMLYEGLAAPVRAFEQLLSYYRSRKTEIPCDSLTEQLRHLFVYVESELKILENGGMPEGDGKAVEQEILAYLAQVSTGEEQEKEKNSGEGKQRFYIAPDAAGEKPEKTEWRGEAVQTGPGVPVRRRSIAISEEELAELQNIVRRGNEAEAKLVTNYRHSLEQIPPEMKELRDVLEELRTWLETASMEQLGHLTVKLRRVIEEMSDSLGKEIELTIVGGDTLVERNRLGKISGALLHLLRNCADHGIELPKERVAAGKTPTGHILVQYRMTDDGSGVIIEVEDDGAGFRTEVISKKAAALGLLEEGEAISRQQLNEVIFAPGFSTGEPGGDYSGRGVGLDAARKCFEELGGSLTAESKEGGGVRFTAKFHYAVKNMTGEECAARESFDSRR